MPIYEYRCEKGHVFDVIQRINDDPLSACQEGGAPAERVLHPVAVHFKGSGFYNTDYGKRKGGGNGAGADAAKESSSESSSSGDSKKTDAKSGDSKPAAATTSD